MVENAIVAVCGSDRIPVGAGIFVADNYIVTCAHVVNTALGKPPRSADKPTDYVDVLLYPDKGKKAIRATVDRWFAPTALGAQSEDITDIAVLKLFDTAPSGVGKMRLLQYVYLPRMKFDAFGFPAGLPKGQWQTGVINRPEQEHRHELLEGAVEDRDRRPFVRPGFSGGPVLVKLRGGDYVAGIVVSARKDEDVPSAYAISALEVARACEGIDIELVPIVSIEHPHVSDLLETKQLKRELFDLRLKSVNDIEEIARLFRDEPMIAYDSASSSPNTVLTDPSYRRLLLQSPGGTGKSTFLRAIARDAIQNDCIPFMLDLARPQIEDVPISTPEGLVERFAVSGNYQHLKKSVESAGVERVILLVDRLNEGTLQSDSVLRLILRLVENEIPGLRVIIAGRLARIPGPDAPKFRLCTVLPLPLEIQRQLLRQHRHRHQPKLAKLFANPFFLNMQLEVVSRRDVKKISRASMFRQFFEKHGSTADSGLAQLSEGAFRAYLLHETTVIPRESWRKLLLDAGYMGDDTIGGAVLVYQSVSGTEVVEFQHQLLQDFLAGSFVAKNCRDWGSDAFDAVTLGGASFEAIEFAAEQLGEDADRFLIQVYDWNYMAVIECIRNLDASRHGASSPVSPNLKDAVYALNALRLFDKFEHTRKRIESVLRDLRPTSGVQLTSVTSANEIKKQVAEHFGLKEPEGGYFSNWKNLFLRSGKMENSDLSLLAEDPLLSWTAVNIFHGLEWDDGVEGIIPVLYRTARAIAFSNIGYRWRLLHLLGGRFSKAAIDLLFLVVRDGKENEWVRYGAVRSLAESISCIPERERRQLCLKKLADFVRSSAQIPSNVLSEIINTAILATKEQEGWYADYMPVLEAGRDVAAAEGQGRRKDLWEARIVEVKKHLETRPAGEDQ